MKLYNLFEYLAKAIESSYPVAILSSFAWGVLSILLSPCHLASIPLIVGFIIKRGKITSSRAFFLSLIFATGILITIALIGIITATAGRMMGNIGSTGNYIVGFIFIVVGLYLVDIIKLPNIGNKKLPTAIKNDFFSALLLGLIFGVALGPCTFAYMAPMLAVVFKMASINLLYSIILLFAYGIGHCSVIVFAGTFTETVQKYLNWSESSKSVIIIKKLCGILLLICAIYMIITAH